MKNKLLKTLGVGALCLTSALGLVACGKDDVPSYEKVEMTKAEAIQMYQKAYDAYRYDEDDKGNFMGSFWAGFELEVKAEMVFSDSSFSDTLRFQRGKVDGKETIVEYEDENYYHIYQTIDNETCMMWQRSEEEGGDVKTTESADIVWTDSMLELFADENEDFFWEAKKDSNNNYILTYINISDEADGDDPAKTWKEITTHEYYINSNGRFTKCVVREENGNFKGMSAEEIAEMDYSGTYTFTFNSSKKFDETWVKGLMTNVEERAKNL